MNGLVIVVVVVSSGVGVVNVVVKTCGVVLVENVVSVGSSVLVVVIGVDVDVVEEHGTRTQHKILIS